MLKQNIPDVTMNIRYIMAPLLKSRRKKAVG
jgi:hypothetical protein